MVTTLDKSVVIPLGLAFMLNATTGGKEKKSYINRIRSLQTCVHCLDTAPTTEDGYVLTDPNFCQSECKSCESIAREWLKILHQECEELSLEEFLQNDEGRSLPCPCASCSDLGHITSLPQLRRCDKCLRDKCPCVKLAACMGSMDCASTNRSAMKQVEAEQKQGSCDLNVAICLPTPDGDHLGKRTCLATENKCQVRNGRMFWQRMLHVLFDDPRLKPKLLRLGVTTDAVYCKDRMDPIVMRQRTQCGQALENQVDTIVDTVVPSLRKLEESNPRDYIRRLVDIASYNSDLFFFLGVTGEQGDCSLFEAAWDYPIKLAPLLQCKDGRALAQANGVLFIAMADCIRVHDIEGTNIALDVTDMTSTQLSTELDRRGEHDTRHLLTAGKAWLLFHLLQGRDKPMEYHPEMLHAHHVTKMLLDSGVSRSDMKNMTPAQKRAQLSNLRGVSAENMAQMEREMTPSTSVHMIRDDAMTDISAISVEPVASVDKCSEFIMYLLAEKRSKVIVLHVDSDGVHVHSTVTNIVHLPHRTGYVWNDICIRKARDAGSVYLTRCGLVDGEIWRLENSQLVQVLMTSSGTRPMAIASGSSGLMFVACVSNPDSDRTCFSGIKRLDDDQTLTTVAGLPGATAKSVDGS